MEYDGKPALQRNVVFHVYMTIVFEGVAYLYVSSVGVLVTNTERTNACCCCCGSILWLNPDGSTL